MSLKFSSRLSTSAYSPSIAITSLKATPTPEKSLNGLLSSCWWALTTATAFGIAPEGIWWSVITVSMPKEFA